MMFQHRLQDVLNHVLLMFFEPQPQVLVIDSKDVPAFLVLAAHIVNLQVYLHKHGVVLGTFFRAPASDT